MKKLIVLAVLILALSASMAMAWTGTEIQGSAAIYAIGVARDNTIFNMSTVFTMNELFASTGTGDFSAVPASTPLSAMPVQLDTTNLTAWTIGNAAFGMWTTTGGSSAFITMAGSTFLNVALTGTFTPGTMFTGKTANVGIMNISFTKAGLATSFSGTMDLASRTVPEASTMVGFGSALAIAEPGLIGWLRRRKA